MSSYAMNYAVGTGVAPFFSSDKGTFGNRVDCAGSQIKNSAVSSLQLAAVGGASVGTAYLAKANANAINKSAGFVGKVLSKAGSAIAGPLKKAAQLLGKTKVGAKAANIFSKIGNNNIMKTITKACSKVGRTAAKNPAAAIAVAALAVGTMAIGYITQKHAYKAGQIDQKYTDRANAQTLAG